MATGTRLAEIAEGDAPPEIAALYRELRASFGVPMVALFYRNLASIDGALPWMWSIMAPLAGSASLFDAAARAVASGGAVAPIAHIGAAASADAIAVVDAYNRANPINLVAASILSVLLKGDAGDAARPYDGGAKPRALPVAPRALPRMIAVDALPPDTLGAIAGLAIPATKGDGIVPSLYRHLANWPDLLSEVLSALPPRFEDGSIARAAAGIGSAAKAEAAGLAAGVATAPLPSALAAQRKAVEASVAAFLRRIPEMIVVGRLLRDALDGARER